MGQAPGACLIISGCIGQVQIARGEKRTYAVKSGATIDMTQIIPFHVERPAVLILDIMSGQNLVEDLLPGGRVTARGVGQDSVEIENRGLNFVRVDPDHVHVRQYTRRKGSPPMGKLELVAALGHDNEFLKERFHAAGARFHRSTVLRRYDKLGDVRRMEKSKGIGTEHWNAQRFRMSACRIVTCSPARDRCCDSQHWRS